MLFLTGCQENNQKDYVDKSGRPTSVIVLNNISPRSNNVIPIFNGTINETSLDVDIKLEIYKNSTKTIIQTVNGIISMRGTWYANSTGLEDGFYYAVAKVYNKFGDLQHQQNTNLFEIDTVTNFTVQDVDTRRNIDYISYEGTMDSDVKNIYLEITNRNGDIQVKNADLSDNSTWSVRIPELADDFYQSKITAIDTINNSISKSLSEIEIDKTIVVTIDEVIPVIGELSTDGSDIINLNGTVNSDIEFLSLKIQNSNLDVIYENLDVSFDSLNEVWNDQNISLPDNKITEDKYTVEIKAIDNLGNESIVRSNQFIINSTLSMTINDMIDFSATKTPNFTGELDNDIIKIELEIKNDTEDYILDLLGNINYPYWDSLTTEDLPDDYYTVTVKGITAEGVEKIITEKNGFTVNSFKLIYSYCKDGEIGTLNVDGYTIVDETMLREIVNGTSNLGLTVDQICTTRVTNMSNLFKDKTEFNGDITKWDTTNVTNMSSMFENATSFNSPINNFVTSSVTDMTNMFKNAILFNQVILFETESVQDMSSMFHNASAFNQLLKFDTRNVEKMNNMFNGANSYNQITTFNLPIVKELKSMFQNNLIFNSELNLTTHEITVNNSGTINDESDDIITIKHFLSTTADMFNNAIEFNQPLNFDTERVSDMSGMFNNAIHFNGELTLNTSNVQTMANMFYNSQDFNQSITSFDTQRVDDMSNMFKYAQSFDSNISNWDVSSVINMSNMFYNAAVFDQNISNWDTSSVENMDNMFQYAYKFNQDLNGLCLEFVLEEPINFFLRTDLWEEFNKPSQWGIVCP